MLGRVWLLYRIEVSKALRRRQAYAGPLLLVLVVLVSTFVYPIEQDGIADYGFIAYVTPLCLGFLGYVMLLVFCASLVASEMDHGAIRATLVRPVTRDDFLTAKVLAGYSYAVLLTAVVGISSWAVTWLQGDVLGVHLGGELVYADEQMIGAYLGGAFLSLLPQWAGASLAILFSTACRNAATAISLSLGTWIVLDLIKYPLNIAPFIFTTYLESPWQVFSQRCDARSFSWFPMLWQCALASGAVIGVSLFIALVIFRRRNLGTC